MQEEEEDVWYQRDKLYKVRTTSSYTWEILAGSGIQRLSTRKLRTLELSVHLHTGEKGSDDSHICNPTHKVAVSGRIHALAVFTTIFFLLLFLYPPVPVAARSEAQTVFDRWNVGIEG
jgi:hypothetical protein